MHTCLQAQELSRQLDEQLGGARQRVVQLEGQVGGGSTFGGPERKRKGGVAQAQLQAVRDMGVRDVDDELGQGSMVRCLGARNALGVRGEVAQLWFALTHHSTSGPKMAGSDKVAQSKKARAWMCP